jgi:hypothetical protein
MFNAWRTFIKFASHWKNIINNLVTGRHGTHTMKKSAKHTKPKALLNRKYEYIGKDMKDCLSFQQ